MNLMTSPTTNNTHFKLKYYLKTWLSRGEESGSRNLKGREGVSEYGNLP
jgi:hypothetical protein